VWGFHKLSAADYPNIVPATREIHLPVFHGLRDGSYRDLVATGAQGIITFPSLHSALAIAWASVIAARRVAKIAHQPRLQTAGGEIGLAASR
jgi:hypothetical protein